jgi:hypothetical protein
VAAGEIDLEEKDYRLRIVLKVKGRDEKIDVDAKVIPLKDAVGSRMGMFYIDYATVRIEMSQDLLDDMFEEIIWFVTPDRVKQAVKVWFERAM